MSSHLDEAVVETCAADLARQGFAVIPGYLSADEIAAGQENFRRYFPTPEEYFAAAPHRYAWLGENAFSGLINFPFVDNAVNDALTSPKLVALSRRLIGTSQLRMAQGKIWAKYGGSVDHDQPLHMDYGNNTLVYPREHDRFRYLTYFLYYSDIDETSGATRFLSDEHVKGVKESGDDASQVATLRREDHPELYAREVAITGAAGTLVVYTLATYHRGATLGPPPAKRWLATVSYHAAGLGWLGQLVWAHYPSDELTSFLTRGSVEQRTLLGFPAPGDPYWNEETLAGVGRRYPRMDLGPYRDAAAATVEP